MRIVFLRFLRQGILDIRRIRPCMRRRSVLFENGFRRFRRPSGGGGVIGGCGCRTWATRAAAAVEKGEPASAGRGHADGRASWFGAMAAVENSRPSTVAAGRGVKACTCRRAAVVACRAGLGSLPSIVGLRAGTRLLFSAVTAESADLAAACRRRTARASSAERAESASARQWQGPQRRTRRPRVTVRAKSCGT
jgi:hypothetical protein